MVYWDIMPSNMVLGRHQYFQEIPASIFGLKNNL